ncbi:MAG: DUF2169 domain-containing protein [Acidobacteriia bacterium]|nr:DUF2169 domain-containing protein [Terriglobia bacterium]
MTSSRPPIPQPVPASSLPPPEAPPSLQPPSLGPLRVVTLTPAPGSLELGIIFKRTYVISHAQPCRLADAQIPLDDNGAFHEPLAEGIAPSFRSLPEVIAVKTGTDVVVQASARSPRPVTVMRAAVQIGSYVHHAAVFGRRFCDWSRGRIRFTDPEPLDTLPLRYENAYGGRDLAFEKVFLDEVKERTDPDAYRRAKAVAAGMLEANHSFMYPRNRFGKGYIIENRPEAVQGRELPNIERPDDLLTPERIVVGHPFDWDKQPIPAGFDYLDPLSFPRSAMLAIPPPSSREISAAREVSGGLVPPDFFRGNLFSHPPEKLPDLIHPDVSRCASLGLRLPFLRGDEQVVLSGIDPAIPDYVVPLPGETPVFRFHTPDVSFADVVPQLHLVFIDPIRKLLTLTWAARVPLSRPLRPGDEKELATAAQFQMRRA